jgi:CRP-like cAMP-binding protein
MALPDNKPHSVNVVAEGEVAIYRMTYDSFIDPQRTATALTNKLILNMALSLSTRLRLNTEEIKALAEN